MKYIFFTTIVFLVITSFISAQTTVELSPSQDNTLYENTSGSISNGAGQNFFVGVTNSGSKRRALLKFDVASNIPAGAIITSVTLSLTVNKTGAAAHDISVHKLTSDWGEGNSNATGNEGSGTSAQTNDATWLHTFYNSMMWNSAGGDYISTASAEQNVASNGIYEWSSEVMKTDVQNWLDNSNTNFGWILIGSEFGTKTTKRFASKENSSSSSRPVLSITYESDCIEPDIPTIEANLSEICEGETVSLSISSGNLNDAGNWYWYKDECGENILGTGSGFNVTMNSETTIYVRGEGNCVIPGDCGSISIDVNPSYNDTLNIEICTDESFTFGGRILTEEGFYTDNLSSVNGCDSIVNLNLVVREIDTSVTLNGNTLTVASDDFFIQWLDCTTNTIIEGENSTSFTPISSGNYAAILRLNNCIDTTACYQVDISTNVFESQLKTFKVYPNPAQNMINIDFIDNQFTKIILRDYLGKVISQYDVFNSEKFEINTEVLNPGLYFIEIRNNKDFESHKIIVK